MKVKLGPSEKTRIKRVYEYISYNIFPIQFIVDAVKSQIEKQSKLWEECYRTQQWKALANLYTEDCKVYPPGRPIAVGRGGGCGIYVFYLLLQVVLYTEISFYPKPEVAQGVCACEWLCVCVCGGGGGGGQVHPPPPRPHPHNHNDQP